MKPIGAIPADFSHLWPLAIAGRFVDHWIEQAGDTPLFVYDMTVIAARVARFRAAFPGIDLHYAVKANPYPALLQAMAGLVDGFDLASAGELALARTAMDPHRMSFAGPGKRDDELAAAIAAGVTINLESSAEADRALAQGQRLGITPRLAIRVNPEFELRGSGMRMGGRASPFGVEPGEVPALARRIAAAGAAWRGLHIFAGSQALDAAAIIDSHAATLTLAARLAGDAGMTPPLINLGGGFGIPYFSGEEPIAVEGIGVALRERLAGLPPELADARFAIELGRWLVGESGVYLTRVIERKESRGEVFLICDGGLNHQLAATGNLGTVVRRNYPVAVATATVGAPTETVSVAGPLCTPLDRLADQVELPVAGPGDVIAVFMAGAYGLSASPTAFLGHPLPRELLVGG
ncbi:pyridoxal-dependent decarboxylase, exosortase A system-associated [uncultured Sphingomonas sp.]|uniref:pyridoxal-dependent decarboxylase, exosortase A system-associated n=1 Tax=uncultured Sphingomonas sp. TaxID=158754 RepID=UPI0035CC3497